MYWGANCNIFYKHGEPFQVEVNAFAYRLFTMIA
jgi:hypothetical protein